MTFNRFSETLLEGAPTVADAREARDAMKHYSYTSFAFGIMHMMREKGLSTTDMLELIELFSLHFYETDMERYRRTGTFNKEKKI
ncbi:MAG: hypothetical protein ACPH5P_00045 [Akkermansiaceae bacterium]